MTVEINGVTYRFETEYGIRTPAAPCTVNIKDGVVSVETV